MERRDALRIMGGAMGMHALGGLTARQVLAAERRMVSALDPHQRATVDVIAELIMPATDTPGARAAGVTDFIDIIVTEYYHDDERAAFLRGLADVDSRSQADFSRTFLELTEPQQTAILTGLDAESRAMPQGSPPHFFSRIKGLTLYGYYTSEIGMTQELDWTFMPGRYDGNAPLRASR